MPPTVARDQPLGWLARHLSPEPPPVYSLDIPAPDVLKED